MEWEQIKKGSSPNKTDSSPISEPVRRKKPLVELARDYQAKGAAKSRVEEATEGADIQKDTNTA